MSSNTIHAWAAPSKGAKLEPFDYDAGPLGPEHVEVQVEHVGICHSDLSMLDNEWGSTKYPFVPGHEIVGTITAVGSQVKGRKAGDRVGIGWFTGSCLHCRPCMAGDQHMCRATEQTIVGRHGGFADRVRAQWAWTFPLPAKLDAASAGPLFCGGITVFTPLLQANLKPTMRAGVVGIGGLGHLAVKFLKAWGCEVTAFTSSAAKHAEAKALGAHHAIASTDAAALKQVRGSLDLIIVTVNVPLDWNAYVAALRPKGTLHFVGAILQPVPVSVFSLMATKTVTGSGTGSPTAIADMLDFCARHQIAPQVEAFPMAKVNEAMEHLRNGKPRYRVVLTR
ncbi:MAG TPA: NAD(P)-dependent alcohol dehydrogenase [Verrucomicrobiae bacterium]|nr:NAD(P)-dependent alcohol dehydrogenase [Verrucomicrobiae bacterium]